MVSGAMFCLLMVSGSTGPRRHCRAGATGPTQRIALEINGQFVGAAYFK